MATITNVATKRIGIDGKPENFRFREVEDIYVHIRYTLQGNDKGRPLYSKSRGFFTSKDDAELISQEVVEVQELYKKTRGLRIRGEIISVNKGELTDNKIEEIKEIADSFAGYYMGLGHQVACGVYDTGANYEIRYAINPVNYGDGSKYRHNDHEIQQREERFLATALADATGKELADEDRADFEELEYYL